MKRIFIACAAIALLAGCDTKEKTGFRDVLIERFKDDQDLKDYKLDPANIADCVVDEISGTLPGFKGDPRREKFFQAYVRFLNVKSAADADSSVKEFTELFGSAKKAREAATSVTDHVMTCMGKAIDNSEGARLGQ